MTLLAWWDLGDPDSLYVDAGVTKVSADGQLIYRVADKSGNGNHMEQSVAGNRPAYKVDVKNGRSAGLFDGSNDGLILPSHTPWGNPFTQFIVARRTATDGDAYGRFFSHSNTSLIGQVYTDTSAPANQWGLFQTNASGTTSELPGTLCDTWGILTVMWSETVVGGRWDSVDTGVADDPSDGATSSTFATMGMNGSSGEHFKGYGAEVQIHSGALSISAMADIEQGLRAKWMGVGLLAGSAAATPSILARGSFGEYGVNVRTIGFHEDGKLRAITEQGGHVGKRRSR